MKTCTKCGFEGDESLFRKDRNQCLPCRHKYEGSKPKAMIECGECGDVISTRPRAGKDGIYRCKNCSRLRKNAYSLERMNAKAAEGRTNRQPKSCDICNELILDKRAGPGRKDGLFRCTSCQAVRNREFMTTHMREALKGPKAAQYRANRNAGKRAWEERNPEGKRARSLILSTRRRLKAYDYDLSRFKRLSTRELAEVIMNLPKECINCHTDHDLTVEHIKPIVDYPDLALEPSNLTTLCQPCNTRSYFGYVRSKAAAEAQL